MKSRIPCQLRARERAEVKGGAGKKRIRYPGRDVCGEDLVRPLVLPAARGWQGRKQIRILFANQAEEIRHGAQWAGGACERLPNRHHEGHP